MKGQRELKKAITQWLKNNGWVDIKVAVGNEFYYDYVRDIIGISLLIPDSHDRLFKQVFDNIGLQHECDPFILSFFHELGHYETLPYLEDEDLEDEQVFYQIENPTDKDFMNYYYSLRELSATEWAMLYINQFPERVKEFWDMIQPCILNIYKKLGYNA